MASAQNSSSIVIDSNYDEEIDGESAIANLQSLLLSFENLTTENLDRLHYESSKLVLALKTSKTSQSSFLNSSWQILYLKSDKILSERSVFSIPLLYCYCRYLLLSDENVDYNRIITLLERVLKSSPANSQAWNDLGECYWNIGKPKQACESFLASIQHDKTNKEGLRNLAIIFRQLHPSNSEEYINDLKFSLKYAQLAVDCDKDDGMSWVTLGNTLLSEHFHSTNSSISQLKKCLVCYQIAKNDLRARKTPDFYANLGTVYICLENYPAAIQSYSESAKLDKGSINAQKKLSSLFQAFNSIHKAIESCNQLVPAEIHLYTKKCQEFPTNENYSPITISNLQLKEFISPVSLNLCILQVISQRGLISCIVACVDLKGSIGIGNLYGIKQTGVLQKGDVLTVYSPVLKTQNIETECGYKIDIPWISCTNPELLRVNGEYVPQEFMMTATVNIQAYT